MFHYLKSHRASILLTLVSVILYSFFAYGLERSDFIKLIILYSLLYLFAFLLTKKTKSSFIQLASLGIVLRLVFLFAIPNLSQDFYRFIWDGRLVAQGINPYLFSPNATLGSNIIVAQAQELISGMGSLSAGNLSNYPPINQLFFTIAAFLSGKNILGSIMILRLFIILADIGILYFGKRLLEILNLPISNIWWYFLNPFIIIELTGNLHFEGVMLLFFIAAMYFLLKNKWTWSAVLMGFSISVKLLPLLFLPLFIKYFFKNGKNSQVLKKNIGSVGRLLLFYLVIAITTILTFLPFLSTEFYQKYIETTGLWFQKFEFNASIYYVIRWIGYKIVGWNIIETAGIALALAIFIGVMGIALLRKNENMQPLFTSILFAVSFYFLLSTTIHPWYIATPLLLSIFTKYRFPILWSYVVVLSYSAYGRQGFDENLWLVGLEYALLITAVIWELSYPNAFNNRGYFLGKSMK